MSDFYGKDRGRPIDRLYIEEFLALHADDIDGAVLEMQSAIYARRFGGKRVTTVTIVDVDPANTNATLVADLCEPGSLPIGQFDCIILTQTLHLLPDPAVAVQNLWSALAPGGALLITAPTLSRVDLDDPDYWRWTPRGLDRLLRSTLQDSADIDVVGHGNALAGAAFFAGFSAENVGVERLRSDDPNFPVVSCARVGRR